MPGGRLTRQDRRDIAAGLAEGLGFAEIARRLDRPTSTISREVARNGGPEGYRADRAHRATEVRAKRSKPPTRPPQRPITSYGRDPDAVREFEQRLTEVLVGTGLPQMTARVLVSLYITDTGSLTAADLVQRLQVSPASVSAAITFLEAQQLIRRERDPRRRRDTYVVDDDIWYRSWLASVQRNAVLVETARQGIGVLGAGTPAGVRLEEMSQLLGHIMEDMLKAGEHWHEVFLARRAERT
ncbi:helix-turn-helix domain-containing protein [Streptosporangiaceae bacterium NEAU-GS5]|nr:helix-turn-helix domain-containing protein [Streptosporangiaceae bacterium NEAU-GS5]